MITSIYCKARLTVLILCTVALIVPYFSQLLWVGYANYLFIRISKYKPNLPHSDVQVARNVFRLVPVNNERPVSFYRAVGRLFWELGDMTSAREVLNKAVNCQPSNEMTYLWLGQITLSLGYFEEALNAFYQARGGGYLYRHLHLIALSRAVLRREVERAPLCFQCWLDLGDALTGRYRERAGYTERFKDELPPEWPEAITAYHAALRINPHSSDALSALAFALYHSDAVLNNWGPRSYNSGGGIDNERGEKT